MKSPVDLSLLEVDELVQLYYDVLQQLRNRNVIRTKNMIGDLAEYLVINFYNKTPQLSNLIPASAGTKSVDALSRNGERFSIKGTSGSRTGVIYRMNEPGSTEPQTQLFEYLVVARFDDLFQLRQIIEIPWATFFAKKSWHSTMRAYNIGLSKSLLNDEKVRIFNF